MTAAEASSTPSKTAQPPGLPRLAWCGERSVYVELFDGRLLITDLPEKLRTASTQASSDIEISLLEGTVYWPAVDERIAVARLLECEPAEIEALAQRISLETGTQEVIDNLGQRVAQDPQQVLVDLMLLADALYQYGTHKPDCVAIEPAGNTRQCSCGFASIEAWRLSERYLLDGLGLTPERVERWYKKRTPAL